MRILAILCLALCWVVVASAQCHPPHYRDGSIWVDDPDLVFITISMPLRDFTPSKLVCLAASLKQRYKDRSRVPPGTGAMEGPYSTRIDLPATAAPHCHQEINNRCLVALQYTQHPDDHTEGKVVLTAAVTRSGVMNHVRVVKSESVPPGAETILANAAAQNLSTWRLEPASHADEIHIAYSYAIDKSLPHVDGTQVRWALPNDITIRAAP